MWRRDKREGFIVTCTPAHSVVWRQQAFRLSLFPGGFAGRESNIPLGHLNSTEIYSNYSLQIALHVSISRSSHDNLWGTYQALTEVDYL